MPDEVQDNDLLADLLDEEIAAKNPDEEPAVNKDELDALKVKVEELENANTGLLKAKQAQTHKRRGAEERLAQLEGAVSTIISQRQQQGMESLSEAEVAGAKSKGIPVVYDDDGNGWIDQSAVTDLISPYEQKITDLEAKLQHTNAAASASTQGDKVMAGIVGEDERFVPAESKYRAARKWVEDTVFEFNQNNGINRNLNSSEALNHVFGDKVTQDEFAKQFEGIDLIDVVTAEDSEMHFRRTMNNIAKTMTTEDDNILTTPKEKMDSRFQKVLNKPSTLGNQANAKAGQLTVLERVNNISSEDLLEFSDEQIDTLMELMGKE